MVREMISILHSPFSIKQKSKSKSTMSDDDNNPSAAIITIQLQDKHTSLQSHFEIELSDTLSTIFKQYAHFTYGFTSDDELRKNLTFAYNDKVLAIDGDDTPASILLDNYNKSDNIVVTVSLIGQALQEYTLVNAITTSSISETISIITSTSNNGDEQQQLQMLTKPLKWTDSDGQALCSPAIFIAIDYGLEELLKELLPLYGDSLINTITSEQDGKGGYTPLQWASWTGSLPIVKLLIEIGHATVDEESVSLSREHDHHALSDYLRQHFNIYANIDKDDIDAIMDKACREGDVEKVRELLNDEQYNLSQWLDDDGKFVALSPMYLAVKFGHYDVVQLFMERGGGGMLDDVESALGSAAAAE